jgi:hypothetical protein
MVCDAVLVTKSVDEVPLSLEKRRRGHALGGRGGVERVASGSSGELSLPAASVTLSMMELLPAPSVAPFQVSVVPLTLLVMSVQLLPPSVEPQTTSVPAGAPLSVALMVWDAVLVMKSVLLAPVSADSAMPLKLVVGAVVSSV